MKNQGLARLPEPPAAEHPSQATEGSLTPAAAEVTERNPWQHTPFSWRRPSVRDLYRCFSGLVLALTVTGQVPDGQATLGATVVLISYPVIELATGCVRRIKPPTTART